MSKYTAKPSEIRSFIADIKFGKKTNDAIYKFKMLVNSRL